MNELREILRRYWGYDEFRPLQAAAMQAAVEGRDSVVVLPTGGGKSLCFQVPALHLAGMAVVVSPLISLMKDQVDALTDCGVPAAYLNSTSSLEERRRVVAEIRAGRLKLLYLSPERLMTEQTLAFLRDVTVSFFAIDEAHCISDWGHDFRPEYRALRSLKTTLPGAAIHAYTATATERVRDDIAAQLSLERPAILVGSFDRPNLTYRASRRSDLQRQVGEVIDRHEGESGIIYCIRRRDVEEMCAALVAAGRKARPYHAGMDDEDRRRNQEQFASDEAQIIVATVAFGMGIDKPDVRFVVHAAAPKSLEEYQQQSGRAGRDGLEAECCLFYSPADFVTWRKLLQDSSPAALEAATTLLAGMERFCTSVDCRHRAITSYFGETLPGENCGACDVCLGELELMSDALVVAQKILSCVLRVKEGYGANYVGQVLVGSRDQRILEQGHDRLSTHGILSEHRKSDVRMWIDQLIAQQFLTAAGEYRVLMLTPSGREVLRGELAPQLSRAANRSRRASKAAADSWDGVDRELFEHLRAWRRQKAAERGVPPFVIFSDVTLRDLARRRPTTPDRLLSVSGIGEKKSADYGAELIDQIAGHCQRAGLAMNV